MRGRQRRKLAKKRAHEKLKQLIHYIISKADICEPTKADCLLKIRLLLFHCDFEHYRWYGKPMLPIGFAWVKAADGPDLIWKGERRWPLSADTTSRSAGSIRYIGCAVPATDTSGAKKTRSPKWTSTGGQHEQ